MENKLSVTCSPGTYKLIEEDGVYRQQLANEVLAKQDKSYNEVVFMPIESEETNQEASEAGPSSPRDEQKQFWSDSATKLMLSLMEDLRPKLGKSFHVKNKMYKIAAENMGKQGYSFSAVQIENKFRGLERQYKKIVLNNRQTGRSRQTCAYESELSKILGMKASVIPEFVLESGDTEGTFRSPEVDESDIENSQKDDVPSCSNSGAKKKRQASVKEQLLANLSEMKEEKKEFHAAVLDLLKKKDEREQNREKRAEKKLELLERLLNRGPNNNF